MKNEVINIIFLDVDGVLNQLQKDFIDTECVNVLVQVSKRFNNANVVLISSWRKGYSNFVKFTPQVKILKQLFIKEGIEIVGRTKELGDRYEEIKDYLQSFSIDDYIILDDDLNEYSNVPDKLYLVNYRLGLVHSDIKMITKKYIR